MPVAGNLLQSSEAVKNVHQQEESVGPCSSVPKLSGLAVKSRAGNDCGCMFCRDGCVGQAKRLMCLLPSQIGVILELI
jgi:hypothetical protein